MNAIRPGRAKLIALLALLAPLLLAGSCKRPAASGPAPVVDETPNPAPAAEPSAETPQKEETAMSDTYSLTLEEKKWLMKLAKDAVKAAVEGQPFEPPEPSSQILKDKGAAFVTLRKNGALRGCIGHIVAMRPLYRCVAEVARSAALEDPRFPEVTPKEVGLLDFEISVLTPPEPVKDPLKEIVVGRDGVILAHGSFYQGVFLPQVPVEQGWDLVEYLDNLCYKAGVMRKGCWKDSQAALKKFQAVVWDEKELK